MIYYVIRHKATGVFLPARTLASRYEFLSGCGGLEPRLFKTHRAATNCVTAWARGMWKKETRSESEGWEFGSYTVEAEPWSVEVPGRNRDDLEVLAARLVFLGVGSHLNNSQGQTS